MGATPDEMTNELWYLRRGEQVRGPYRWDSIARNAGLGRIHDDDRLSRDQNEWLAPADVTPRLPAVGALAGSVHDERRSSRRLAEAKVPAEQRAGADRRAAEAPEVINRRARSERVWQSLRPGAMPNSARLPLLAIGLALSLSLALAMRLSGAPDSVAPDCRAVAASGVNWDFCAKPRQQLGEQDLNGMSARNAQLSGSSLANARLHGVDFAYADLSSTDFTLADARQARLVGASLRHAVLNHARLTGADLSFADLSGASLVGAELSAARLTNTIWTDGRVCARDSIGVCNAQ
ncbi:MAG: pentapeptide repeat-containing protein [Gammaproteobacteria bacterium]|nr:pentapeptide repeat-containing protein [Gammaproteobacteria bacterium]